MAIRLDLDPGLRGIAALIHTGRILDGCDAATAVYAHYLPPSRAGRASRHASGWVCGSNCWSTRCIGSRAPSRLWLVIARRSAGNSTPVASAAASSVETVDG